MAILAIATPDFGGASTFDFEVHRMFEEPDSPCEPTSNFLRVHARTRRDEIVLAVSGEADVAHAALLAHALTDASRSGSAQVTVDLSDLEFIDTHCLSLILAAHDKLRARGTDLVIRSPPPSVQRLLGILRRQDVIEACPNAAAAARRGDKK